MQLGKTLVGAILGAALGIGLLAAVYLTLGVDHAAMAIGVALLTGLGVRMMVSTSGHASYARGALTGILALAAYVAGWVLVAELAKARVATAPKPAVVKGAKAAAPGDADAAAPDAEAVPVAEVQGIQRAPVGTDLPKAGAPGQNPLDYVWLAIAGLVAYELGRGTGTVRDETAPMDGTGDGDPALSRQPEPEPIPGPVQRPPD